METPFARETATCMGNLRWDRAAVAWKIQLTGGIKLPFQKNPIRSESGEFQTFNSKII